jgi:HEAT repeat protein
MKNWGVLGVVAIVLIAAGGALAAAPLPAESARMVRAKDLISDDQWMAAIPVLRAAAADPKEPNKDEALFWLAHSQNQAGDLAEAVESIRTLQRDFPKSKWAEPAGSLMIELAQKLGRRDVLWKAATPPPPPTPPEGPAMPAGPRAPRTRKGPAMTPPAPPPPPPAAMTPGQPAPPAPPVPPPAITWFADSYAVGADLRVQALGQLIKTDAQKVIPILRKIALEPDDPGAARRAVFVLAQSRNPDAQSTVVDVAKTGPEPVRVAAVRGLGLFGGPEISTALLEVYSTANMPVKRQVVVSLGERADAPSLFRIAQSENDDRLRDTAIVTLGKVGGREQLRVLFSRASKETRLAVIRGLFLARDDDGLIHVAGQEKDPELRSEVLSRLRLIGTPKAKDYLASLK